MRYARDYPKYSLQPARCHSDPLVPTHKDFTNNFLVGCPVRLSRITNGFQPAPLQIVGDYRRSARFTAVKPFLFTGSPVVLCLLTLSILGTPISSSGFLPDQKSSAE